MPGHAIGLESNMVDDMAQRRSPDASSAVRPVVENPPRRAGQEEQSLLFGLAESTDDTCGVSGSVCEYAVYTTRRRALSRKNSERTSHRGIGRVSQAPPKGVGIATRPLIRRVLYPSWRGNVLRVFEGYDAPGTLPWMRQRERTEHHLGDTR